MSLARHVHPEFGWFCPSLSLRRRARIAFVTLVFLMIVGVVALRAGRGPSFDEPLTVRQSDAAESVAAIIQTDGLATAAERSSATDRVTSACERDPWRFIAGKCNAGAIRRARAPRPANEAPTIAALPLGRTTLLQPAPSAGFADLTDIVDTAAPTPAVADPPKVPAPSAKKARNLSRVQNNYRDVMHDRSWRNERWAAYAYGWSDDPYLRGRYSRSWVRGSW